MNLLNDILNRSSCIAIRGSRARGNNLIYSDYDFVLLQEKKNTVEFKQVLDTLKLNYKNNFSLIHYDSYKVTVDLLFLVTIKSMRFFFGSKYLFNEYKNQLEKIIGSKKNKELFRIFYDDIFSKPDIGFYKNIKNGAFSTLRFEFCEVLNSKTPTINIEKYKKLHIFIRQFNFYEKNGNRDNSYDFENLLFKNNKLTYKILQLKIYRVVFLLHFNYLKIKYKIIDQ